MKRTYLIQRLCQPKNFDNPFSFGGGYINGGLSKEAMDILRPIFSFDYMGSAEFEFGALPKALQIISDRKNVSGEINGVHYICSNEQVEYVEKTIKQLIEDEYRLGLRESCRLSNVLNGTNGNIGGWIELNNGFMFFTDETMFNKTKELFVEQ